MHGDTTKKLFELLAPQCLVGLIDAISFMVVTPSLLFYVLSFGGSKEQYGIILSGFSLASFMAKPVLGFWCDQLGCKFRSPYLFSIAVAAIGGLLYFFASTFAGSIALILIFVARFLGGVGAANSTLGFTYVASIVPLEQLTKANAILSMVRIFGMAVAPALNIFLSKVNGTLFSLEVTPWNSIGLVLFSANSLSFLIIYCMLSEPSEEIRLEVVGGNDKTDDIGWMFWRCFLSIEILVPIASILCLNANFQLLEAGLAPASSHALHWGTVEISTVFGLNAIWIFLVVLTSFYLTSAGVSDYAMLIVGFSASIIGYSLMYVSWTMNASIIQFVAPIAISTIAFPFLGAPTRSLFTKVVNRNVHLRKHQGTMQAVLSMTASVAGFVAPGLIARFVLRTPEQVESSREHRELTAYALFAPISSVVILIGILYLKNFTSKLDSDLEQTVTNKLDETTELLPSANTSRATVIVSRRHSEIILGVPNIMLHTIDNIGKNRRSVAF